jgi:hypothetical protein
MPKFSLGQIVATAGALAAIQEAQGSFWPYLQRHSDGDWGEVLNGTEAQRQFCCQKNIDFEAGCSGSQRRTR